MPLGEQGCCRPAHLTGHLSGSAEPGHAAMCQNRQPPPERLGFFLPPRNGSFESCSRGKTVEGRSAVGYLGEGGPGGHHMGALKALTTHFLQSRRQRDEVAGGDLSVYRGDRGTLHRQERGPRRTRQAPSLPPPCAGPGAPRGPPVGQREANPHPGIAGWSMDPGPCQARRRPEAGCVLKRTFVHFSPSEDPGAP